MTEVPAPKSTWPLLRATPNNIRRGQSVGVLIVVAVVAEVVVVVVVGVDVIVAEVFWYLRLCQ